VTVWISKAAVSDAQAQETTLTKTVAHIEIVDYNSWVESDKGRKLANSLDKDVVLAEGM
jgi:hypothetical protein